MKLDTTEDVAEFLRGLDDVTAGGTEAVDAFFEARDIAPRGVIQLSAMHAIVAKDHITFTDPLKQATLLIAMGIAFGLQLAEHDGN